MSLPTSRPRTYVNGTPVIPDDLNEIFDSIIDAKLPLLTIDLDILNVVINAGASGTATPLSAGTNLVVSATTITAGISIGRLPHGTRIVNARVYLKDVSGQPALRCSLRGTDRAGSFAENAVVQSSAATGANQTITLAALNHIVGVTTVGPAYICFRNLTVATGTYTIYAVELDIDRL